MLWENIDIYKVYRYSSDFFKQPQNCKAQTLFTCTHTLQNMGRGHLSGIDCYTLVLCAGSDSLSSFHEAELLNVANSILCLNPLNDHQLSICYTTGNLLVTWGMQSALSSVLLLEPSLPTLDLNYDSQKPFESIDSDQKEKTNQKNCKRNCSEFKC